MGTGHPFYVKSKVVQGKDIRGFLDNREQLGYQSGAWKNAGVLLALPGPSKLLWVFCPNWHEEKSISCVYNCISSVRGLCGLSPVKILHLRQKLQSESLPG